MDDDLKQVLEAMREENAAAHAETRRRFETLEARFEAAQVKFDEAQSRNADAHAKTRRHIDVAAEAHQHKLDLVVERVLANGEKIDQLDAKFGQITSNHETRITRLEVAASLQGQI